MKIFKLSVIIILFLSFGKIIAQKFTVSLIKDSVTEMNENNSISYTMPYWEENWTKESIIAINKIIEEYGCPDEQSPNRLYWVIPGIVQRTITYTENFLFYLPDETNSCNNDNNNLITKNYQL